MKEYIYEARIIEAETNNLIVKISSYSEEGLEEEMGKTKWTEAIKREEEAEERFMKIDEEQTLPEDDFNKEKEAELINEANRLAEDIN